MFVAILNPDPIKAANEVPNELVLTYLHHSCKILAYTATSLLPDKHKNKDLILSDTKYKDTDTQLWIAESFDNFMWLRSYALELLSIHRYSLNIPINKQKRYKIQSRKIKVRYLSALSAYIRKSCFYMWLYEEYGTSLFPKKELTIPLLGFVKTHENICKFYGFKDTVEGITICRGSDWNAVATAYQQYIKSQIVPLRLTWHETPEWLQLEKDGNKLQHNRKPTESSVHSV